jgi:galactokinase
MAGGILISIDDYFDGIPYTQRWAPGRVNLLGEHTDYNDGYMLPVATPQRTVVAAGFSSDDMFRFYSATLSQSVLFAPEASAPPGFGRYIEGCIRMLEREGATVPPLRIYVRSDLPVGAGLSSSAALEVATLRALRSLLGIRLDDVALAVLAQQAEILYAKVNCGIMDQMAASLADSEHMLFLDARSLASQLLPLPHGSELIVIDSGVPRTLATSKYNERRAECEEAARLLGVRALRDVMQVEQLERLPLLLRRRARHVVTENQRVLDACAGVSADRFGQLMNESHASLRDDYQVSIGELDELTDRLRRHPGVYGARLTGAGFGGACVALCAAARAQTIGAEVVADFNAAGYRATLLIPPNGATTSGQP